MLAGCLLTAILIVMPAQSEMGVDVPARWLFNQPILQGVCSELFPEGKMFVESQRLIILYLDVRYVIPFPPAVGRWPLKWWVGSAEADLGVWGMVQVRMGPKLPI